MNLQTKLAKAFRSYIKRDYSTSKATHYILQQQFLWLLFLRIILYTLLLVGSYFISQADCNTFIVPHAVMFFFILVVYIFTIFSAFYLLISPHNGRRFGFIQILADAVFVTVLVLFTGSSTSNFTPVYFFPIIAGGLLLPLKGGLVAAAASTLFYGSLLALGQQQTMPWLQSCNLFAPVEWEASLNIFAVHGGLFFLAGVLSIFFGIRLRRTETALDFSLKQLDHLSEVYKQIFDNISTGLLTVDSKYVITSANKALASITGYRVREMLGKTFEEIFPDIHIETDVERLTTDFTTRYGKRCRLGFSCMNVAHDDNLNHEEDSVQMIIAMRDITEVENLERQVRQAEKLAAIGTMSASIAHDFRNPLTAISGSAQILAADFLDGSMQNDSSIELSNIIIRECDRLSSTIGEFLKFARPEELQPQFIQLDACLAEVMQVLRAGGHFPETALLRTEYQSNLAVWADEKQLFTVLDHLIDNAIPFCPEGQEIIRIKAEETALKENRNGQAVIQIKVEDNGKGIAEEFLPHIFDPFYTTRPDGTGLGLAIVHQIIQEHRGGITAENIGLENSEGTRGACFTFWLPLPE